MFEFKEGEGYIVVKKQKVIRYETKKKAALPTAVVEKLSRSFEPECGAREFELEFEPEFKLEGTPVQPPLGHVLQLSV